MPAIQTVMTTAVGVATAKWIEDPQNLAYERIIFAAGQVVADATKHWTEISLRAGAILRHVPDQVADLESQPDAATAAGADEG